MNTEDIEKFLLAREVRPTSNRILVVRALLQANHPISLADLEIVLDTLDKSSIFRVLELLAEREVIHLIEDGSRSVKYEICHNDDHHTINDQHVHFYCEKCNKTFCFEDVSVPSVEIPLGFRPRAVNYVVKGLCAQCAERPEQITVKQKTT